MVSPKTCPRHILWGNDYMESNFTEEKFPRKIKRRPTSNISRGKYLFRWKRQVKHAYQSLLQENKLEYEILKVYLMFFSRIILMVERKFTKEGRQLRILVSLLFFETKFFVKTCRRFLSVLSLIQLIIQCQSINSTGKGQVE